MKNKTIRERLAITLEQGKNRLIVVTSFYALLLIVFSIRLVDLALIKPGFEPAIQAAPANSLRLFSRANIVDRNGNILATNLRTSSIYADATEIQDPEQSGVEIQKIFPELDLQKTVKKLKSDRRFIWIKRNITPKQKNQVLKLGIPGVYFQEEEKRIYPYGNLFSHLIGFTDVDSHGVAGVEKYFDQQLLNQDTELKLTLDARIQHIVRQELIKTIEKFSAKGGISIILDADSAEVLSIVSLPDFNPNQKITALGPEYFAQATAGIYEMGSVMKIINTAMTLDSGKLSMSDGFDTKKPFIHSGFRINDFKPQHRWLSIPEIFQYSSNIGSAQMAIEVGTPHQKKFFKKLGFLHKPKLPIVEIASPLYPSSWREIHTVTMSYGHGIAITPIQLIHSITPMVNGGMLHPLKLVKNREDYPTQLEKEKRIVSKKTSEKMRKLLRLVVTDGTGSKSDVPGYFVGGKTGSAEKAQGGGYNRKANYSSFIATFPVYDPKFVILVMIDEPQGIKETFGYATGGWVSAPAAREMIKQIGPLYKVEAIDPEDEKVQTKLKIETTESIVD